ncbi:MAG: hypothetical protein OEW60_09050, partial [Thiovulaceae bacterium]|nr:hypothetical protein [Sulfurimonadaceae bacterium]
MNKHISFDTFVKSISKDIDLNDEALKELIYDLFATIRKCSEYGQTLFIEELGEIHPLWYDLKRAKERAIEEASMDEKTSVDEAEKREIFLKKLTLFKRFELIRQAQETQKLLKEKQQKEAQEKRQQQLKLEAAKQHKREQRKQKNVHLLTTLSLSRQRFRKRLTKKVAVTNEKPITESQHPTQALRSYVTFTTLIKKHPRVITTLISASILLSLFLLWDRDQPYSKEMFPVDTNESQEEKLYQNFKTVNDAPGFTNEQLYKHRIVSGDSLYLLSQRLYGDSKFWPLIYIKNSENIQDMDLIYPGKTLIVPRIEKGSTSKEELAKVYIKAYERYKQLGKENKAQWLLYWGYNNIDTSLLKTYE